MLRETWKLGGHRALASVKAGGLALLVPVTGLALFGSTGRDDAYITFWVAEQLAATGRVVNYNQATLEQSSSLLHVGVLAALLKLTSLPTPTLAFWLGILCAMACVPIAMALARRSDARAATAAGWFVATSAPATYWAFGSLETSLATLVLLGFLLAVLRAAESWGRRRVVAVALAALLLVIARPEFGIVALAAIVPTAAWLWRGPSRAPEHARCLASVAGLVAVWSTLVGAARLAYFGTWFPQPVAAKTGLGVRLNLAYVWSTLFQSLAIGITLLALVGFVRALRGDSKARVLVPAIGFMGLAGVAASGGDWMECGRLLAPWLVVLSVVAAATAAAIERRVWRAAVVAAVVVLGIAGEANYALRYSTGTPIGGDIALFDAGGQLIPPAATLWPEAHNRPHARDAVFVRSVEPILRSVIEQQRGDRALVVASGQAGMVVYSLKRSFGDRFRFVDRRGLATADLDRCGADVPRTAAGMAISYQWWLEHPELCGPAPDVILDAGDFGDRGGLAERYRLTFQQQGSITRVDALGRPRRERGIGQFMAVRRDLWPE